MTVGRRELVRRKRGRGGEKRTISCARRRSMNEDETPVEVALNICGKEYSSISIDADK